MNPKVICSPFSNEGEISHLGGKAANLIWLAQHHYQVPPFLVIPHHAQFHTSDIENYWKDKSYKSFAVRSSVNLEDGQSTSFAGLFDSQLNVSLQDFSTAIEKVFASVHSPRVEEYLRHKKISADLLKMNVIVQAMIQPKFSGVAFSRSPLAPTSEGVVEVVEGLGEALVSGHSNAEHFCLNRFSQITKRISQGIKIDEILVKKVFEITLKIENDYQRPCDVEWCIDQEDKIWILQVRPITTALPKLYYLADTNLSESYPGVTSPLTCSFVMQAYTQVFVETAELLGATKKRRQELLPFYQTLIQEVHHHLYYNLESYHTVLAAIPGGEKNIENWYRMIGGEFQWKVPRKNLKALSSIDKIVFIFKFLSLMVFHQKKMDHFEQNAKRNLTQIKKEIAELKTAQESFKKIISLVATPMGFGLTALNDLVIMTSLKILTRLVAPLQLSEKELVESLNLNRHIASTAPLVAMEKLKSLFHQESEAGKILRAQAPASKAPVAYPYEHIFSELNKKNLYHESNALKEFLEFFGERSFGELKLECFPFSLNPSLLTKVIDLPVVGPQNQNSYQTKVLPTDKLALWRRWPAQWAQKILLNSIQYRESTRLLRGQFYHLIRLLAVRSYDLLKAEEMIDPAVTPLDLFNLRLKDFERNLVPTDKAWLQEKLKQNQWQSLHQIYPEFLLHAEGESLTVGQSAAVSHQGQLQGQIASPGLAQGKPLVLDDPLRALEISDLHQYILVTKNTDPAWVYIMGRCQGLISEKGSLLSHTAIIGRELNKPTLVGVQHACQKLMDKKLITLDANQGIITYEN